MPISPETIPYLKSEVYSLFGELLDLSPEERERYYRERSVPDDLRREIESLLLYDSGRPLTGMVQAAMGLVFEEPAGEGDTCGPFRLLRQIGRGGMGVVYLAERTDGEVRQRVAVKLLRAALDSPTARRRFLQERQILANLAHPNIARLLDAGHRADGQPYLAMEYIEGRPIDEHSRELPVRDKVALVVAVCEAMASAHRSLVVHRDLKPGNILVDVNGSPRVLDFGIAKLMDADETATVERRLTPDYASPEQIGGFPVTTATDIYSLGAVLYKLLTGDPPERPRPAPPGRRVMGVDRDLDAIVLKTLRVEPEERYATADQLAEDLRAWLAGRPVSARHGERWYRARRQLRRHWIAASAGVVAVSGLAGGFIAARKERDIAQERFEEVRKLANEYFTLEKDLRTLPGSTPVRERIVTTSVKYLEGLTKRAGGDWRLKTEIAAGYRKAAEAQGISGSRNLERPGEAIESLRKAEALLRDARAAAPEERGVLHDLIDLVNLQARMEYVAKNTAALNSRLGELRQLLAEYESKAKDEPGEWQFLGRVYEWMAVSGKDLKQPELPMEFARRSLELRKKVVARDPSLDARGSLATSYNAYAGMLRASGDLAGAVEANREAVAALEAILAVKPDHYVARVNLASTHAYLGRSLGDPQGPSLGQTAEAIRHLEASHKIGRELMAADPTDSQIRFNHALTAWRLGDLLRASDPRRAPAVYDEAIALLRPFTAKRFTRDAPLTAALAESAIALEGLGRHAEASTRLQEAKSICEPHQGQQKVLFETCSEFTTRAEGVLALAAGRPADAVAAYRRWLDPAEAGQDGTFYAAHSLASRYALLRDALRRAGDREEAERVESKRREVVARLGRLAGRL